MPNDKKTSILNTQRKEVTIYKDFYTGPCVTIGIYVSRSRTPGHQNLIYPVLTMDQECAITSMLEAHGKAIGEEARRIIEGDTGGDN